MEISYCVEFFYNPSAPHTIIYGGSPVEGERLYFEKLSSVLSTRELKEVHVSPSFS